MRHRHRLTHTWHGSPHHGKFLGRLGLWGPLTRLARMKHVTDTNTLVGPNERRRSPRLCPLAKTHPRESVLRDELLALQAGALVTLEVDGVTGTWAKMEDGKGGSPATGLKALGAAQDHWYGRFKANRGVVVAIAKRQMSAGPAAGKDNHKP